MSDKQMAWTYLDKAGESLAGAESECANGRFNNCANRAYYAAFQAAIAALLQDGVRARDGRWAHKFVQAEFAGKLINRRHRYPSRLRETLPDLLNLRHRADYRDDTIRGADAVGAVRRSREFVESVWQGSERA